MRFLAGGNRRGCRGWYLVPSAATKTGLDWVAVCHRRRLVCVLSSGGPDSTQLFCPTLNMTCVCSDTETFEEDSCLIGNKWSLCPGTDCWGFTPDDADRWHQPPPLPQSIRLLASSPARHSTSIVLSLYMWTAVLQWLGSGITSRLGLSKPY